MKKLERKPSDKWHLDEMALKIKGEKFVLWRAVDQDGIELDVFLQKRRNKRSAIRFLSRLLGTYPAPRVIVTDKLKSYVKPIQFMCRKTDHRTHKRLKKQGIDDALIQPYSGHESRQSLEIYSKLSITEAQSEYESVIKKFPI